MWGAIYPGRESQKEKECEGVVFKNAMDVMRAKLTILLGLYPLTLPFACLYFSRIRCMSQEV